jgi:tetratricopeptide (TPR) repeat protein
MADAVAILGHERSRTQASNMQQPGQQPAADLFGHLTEVARGYQFVLEKNPAQPAALVGMCLVALASRQTEAAVQMANAAVASAPEWVEAWVALGQALKAAARHEEAAESYQRAIRLDGMNALAHLGLGELKIAGGRPEEAVAEFELALKRRPALIGAHLGLGNALASLGRNEEALERYEAALALRPRLPEGEFAAGFALARLGRIREAETRYRRAIAARPDFAAAWINLGSLLREQGKDLFAEAALRRAIALRPDLVSAWLNLAALERERCRPEVAETYLHKAFALNSSQIETLIAWCQLCVAERDLADAWGWLRLALERNPDFDEAVNLHGILLHLEERFADAVVQFERAETLGNRAAASNRGNSLLDLGRMREALAAHEAAVERDPSSAGAKYNLALTQLRLGDWERGWTGYEARWHFREVHRRPRFFKQPRWRGENLHGERVLLHAEQGLGDTIQFCRYAALVAARGGVPILQVQPAAERLMRSLAVARAGLAQTAVLGTDPEFDLECPLLSLPAVFRTSVDTVPWEGTYLGADAELAAEKLARFPGAGDGLRVGLAWAGNPRYKADRARSMRLATLLPLLRAANESINPTWISLQKGEAAEQLAGLPHDFGIDVCVRDGSSCERDLAETAALVAGLDLVITTDTCVAHLAGAMDKPVWILLPHLADWRWMQDVETSPWYPSARLFRQSNLGDWSGVVERVGNELQALSKSSASGQGKSGNVLRQMSVEEACLHQQWCDFVIKRTRRPTTLQHEFLSSLLILMIL